MINMINMINRWGLGVPHGTTLLRSKSFHDDIMTSHDPLDVLNPASTSTLGMGPPVLSEIRHTEASVEKMLTSSIVDHKDLLRAVWDGSKA